MSKRNTPLLAEITALLNLPESHLATLEAHFKARLIMNVGSVEFIESNG